MKMSVLFAFVTTISIIAIIASLPQVKGTVTLAPVERSEDLYCEQCGGPPPEPPCYGPNATTSPTEKKCSYKKRDYCSRKYIIRGELDQNTPEIVERKACIPSAMLPPYDGCKYTPNTATSPGSLECYCNTPLGQSFKEIDTSFRPPKEIVHQLKYEFCNARLQCYQCVDCRLPENPELCSSPLDPDKFIERDFGRLAFCTVKVKNGVVLRQCAQNPVLYPDDEWPDCGNDWDVELGQCKCFNQRCNKNLFYVNYNLDTSSIGYRATPLTKDLFKLISIKPRDVELKCHKCDGKANCIKRPEKATDYEFCDKTKYFDICFKEYIYDKAPMVKKFTIERKGCVFKHGATPRKILTPSQHELDVGWTTEPIPRSPDEKRMVFYCDTELCNVVTKCHRCHGSIKCDTATDSILKECDAELLQPGETEEEAARNPLRSNLGIAQHCSLILSGDVVVRSCHAAADFGIASGYFGTAGFFPQGCKLLGWDGFSEHDEKTYQECICGKDGCNSNEIIGIGPKPINRNLNGNGTGHTSQGCRIIGIGAVFMLIHVIVVFV